MENSFLNGGTFDSTGKALNTQAQTDLTNLGVTGNSTNNQYVAPQTPQTPVITPESLKPVTPITLPQPDTSSTGANAVVAGAQTGANDFQKYLDKVTPPTTALDTQNKTLTDALSSLYEKNTGKAAALNIAETTQGVPDLNKQLTDINGQIKVKNADYNAAFNSLENNPQQLAGVVGSKQQQLQRTQASEIGMLSARAQALQGNITLAKETAQKAVDLQYSAIEDQIAVKQQQLALIAPQLTAQQTKQAQALQLKLTDEAQKVADEKATAKENVNLALTSGTNTKFVNKNGTFFDTATGKQFATPADFFKAAGVTSFADAYQKGLVTDLTNSKLQDINFAQQAQAKYPDIRIPQNASPDEVRNLIKQSAIYRKDTYIKPENGSGGGVYVKGANPTVDAFVNRVRNGELLSVVPAGIRGLVAQGVDQSTAIVDPNIDQQVRAIIAANPGEYGHAADAINKLQPGLASKYDSQLKAVYNDKKDVGTAFNNNFYSPTAGSKFTMESNRITSNFVKLPAYVAASQAQVYLPRIAAAAQNPGSVGDAELLDSIVKLNTGGNAITQEQVHLITNYGSYADKLNTWKNQLTKKGGALSDQQRNELVKIAKDTNANYQQAYQPIYDQVTSQLQLAGIPKQFWTIPDLNTLSNKGQSSDVQSLAQQKGFDYQAAKDAGYSDEEIKQAIGQ